MPMNCERCHHTDRAHSESEGGDSLMRLGRCRIPECTCRQYAVGIEKIDEDLL